jgi:hypothetical protein
MKSIALVLLFGVDSLVCQSCADENQVDEVEQEPDEYNAAEGDIDVGTVTGGFIGLYVHEHC